MATIYDSDGSDNYNRNNTDDMTRENEEYYQQGYWKRNKEIGTSNLIVIHETLFELTDQQLKRFKKLYGTKTLDIDAHSKALDYVVDNCLCLNSFVRTLDY